MQQYIGGFVLKTKGLKKLKNFEGKTRMFTEII
jgi:hypothetical protein